MKSLFIFILFLWPNLHPFVNSQSLIANYQFWDFFGARIIDMGPTSSLHAEMKYSSSAPILTDRGLYLSNSLVFLFPKNIYSSFPPPTTSIVVSVWYLPVNTSLIFNLKSNKASNESFSITLIKSGSNTLGVSIGGSLIGSYSSSLPFSSWYLFTFQAFVISGSTQIYMFLNNEEKPFYSIKTRGFDVSSSNISWEIGSFTGSIQGFIHEVWWYDSTDSNQLLAADKFELTCPNCSYTCTKSPYLLCLKPILDPFANSNLEQCTMCTNLSCDEYYVCIDNCRYSCVNPAMCLNEYVRVCPNPCPYACDNKCAPRTDRCYACRLGYQLSQITPGTCDITVEYCKTFLQDFECLKCEDGYYLIAPTICKICLIPDCLECYDDEFGLQKCKNCGLLYIDPDGTCVSDCPIGYYPNRKDSPRICSKCSEFCISCDMDSELRAYCTLCESTPVKYYPTDPGTLPMCSTDCPRAFYRCYPDGNMSNPDCCPCISGCQTCIDNLKCQSCYPRHIFTDHGTYDTCEPCIMNCNECSDTVTCIECLTGYVIYSGSSQSCKVDCKSDQYTTTPSGQCYIPPSGGGGGGGGGSLVDGQSGQGGVDQGVLITITCDADSSQVSCYQCDETNTNCLASMICPPYCITCYLDATVIKCSRCRINYFLNPFTYESCDTDCPQRYYKSTDSSSICIPCGEANCLTCPSNRCELCDNPYYVTLDSKCRLVCPLTSYPDNSIMKCRPCLSNCSVCIDGITCDECVSTHVLFKKGTQYSCVVKCSKGYYEENIRIRECLPCGIDNCIECEKDLIRSKVKCNRCRLGYVAREINSNWLCVVADCPDHCFACRIVENDIICDICEYGYYLSTDQLRCLRDCPVSYYEDFEAGECLKCPENCKKCAKYYIGVTCNECNFGYFIDPNLESGLCNTSCPIGYYGDIISTACMGCQPNCILCKNSSSCNECSPGYFIQPPNTDIACDYKCPAGYYLEDVTCKACISDCIKCRSSFDCLECVEGLYLWILRGNYQCIDYILPGYYSQFYVLLPCTGECSTCMSTTECSKCVEMLDIEIKPEACVMECKEGFYLYKNECLPCFPGCKKCSNAKRCEECKNPLYLQPNGSELKCNLDCPLGYYKQILPIKICKPCYKNCSVCQNDFSCIRCSRDYYLQIKNNQEICDKTCAKGFYPNNSLQICSPCPDLCIDCSISNNKLECINCTKFAFQYELLCKCYDSDNQTKPDECPASCPGKEIDLSSSTCYELSDTDLLVKFITLYLVLIYTITGCCTGALSVSSTGWVMLYTIQIIVFLGMVNVTLPSFLEQGLKAQRSYFISYDLFEDVIGDAGKPFMKAYEFDYYTSAFIDNIGKSVFLLSCMVLANVLVFLLVKVSKGKIQTLSMNVIKKFRFGVFIRFLLSVYLEVIVPALVQIKYPQEQTIYHILQYILSLLFTIFSLLFLYFLSRNLICNKEKLEDAETIEKWGVSYNEFKGNLNINILYYSTFLARRSIIAISLIFLNEIPVVQVTVCSLSCWAIFLYVLKSRPFKEEGVNNLCIFIELLVSVVYSMTIIYLYDTGLDTDMIGWIMFWCINACYVISMSVAIYKLIKAGTAKIRQFRNKRSKYIENTNFQARSTTPKTS